MKEMPLSWSRSELESFLSSVSSSIHPGLSFVPSPSLYLVFFLSASSSFILTFVVDMRLLFVFSFPLDNETELFAESFESSSHVLSMVST